MGNKKPEVTLISNASAYGGVATHLNQFSRALFLSRNVKRVLLFCSTKLEVSPLSCPVSIYSTTELIFSKLSFLRFFIIPLNFLRELFIALRHMTSCVGRDLSIVSHDPNSFWGFVLLSNKANYFLFVTPDVSAMDRRLSLKFYIYKIWRKSLNFLVVRRIKSNRLKLVAPTNYAADIWSRYLGIDLQLIHIFSNPPFLKNPCETIIRDTQSTDIRLHEWLDSHKSGKKLILSVGMMVDYKNPYSWAEIAKKIQSQRDDLFWIWAGDGQELEAVRSILHDTPRVFAVGRLNQKDLKSLYEISWAFFHPAIKESQGIVVMDALTYGIPVILNNSEALPELIKGSEAGLIVECQDVKAAENIAEYLRYLDVADNYKKISQAASALAIERYSYDKWQEDLTNLLKL
jgi:glycosyltransferase involved in cell wall biosynthesis